MYHSWIILLNTLAILLVRKQTCLLNVIVIMSFQFKEYPIHDILQLLRARMDYCLWEVVPGGAFHVTQVGSGWPVSAHFWPRLDQW